MKYVETTKDQVVITDGDGQTRVVLRAKPEGPVALLFDADNTLVGGVSFRPEDGRVVLSLFRDDGEPGAAVVLAGDEPVVVRFDRDGNPTFAQLALEPVPTINTLGVSLN